MSNVRYVYNIDNLGQTVPLPHCVHPVLASGVTLTATTKNTNYTTTVKTGKTYIITSTVGCSFFGLTGTIATAANKEWVCAQNGKVVMRIPVGTDAAATRTLNYGGDTDLTTIYIVECAERA